MKGQTNAKLASKGIQGESVNITLLTNQESHSDLIGAVITVSYGGVDTEYVWEGNDITVQIPSSTDYGISVSYVEGYATPEGFSATSQNGYSRRIEMTYNTELVTVNVSAEEGSISGYEIQIGREVLVPTEYIQLEYIRSTGAQYIDTGVIAKSGIRTKIDCSIDDLSSTSNIFGAYSNSNRFYIHYDISEKLLLGYGAYNRVNYNLQAGTRHLIDAEFKAGKQSLLIDETEIYSGTDTSERTTNCSAFLGAMNSGTSASLFAKMTIYSCQIYDNDILIRDYVPAKDKSGAIGLYDKVNNNFVKSASSTEFIAGNEIGIVEVSQIEVMYTQTTPSAIHKLPYNINYEVKASNVTGFNSPVNQKFTASQTSREVSIIYTQVPYGVYVVDINGNLVNPDEWNVDLGLSGVFFHTEKTHVVIGNTYTGESSGETPLKWSESDVLVNGVFTTTNVTTALTDFDGETNSKYMLSQLLRRIRESMERKPFMGGNSCG